MPVPSDRPYSRFNFLVSLSTVNPGAPDAGFQECSGIGMEATVADYRTGTEKPRGVRRLGALNKATDVTLKRGVIGSQQLHQWLQEIRTGVPAAKRTVTIQLQNEDHTAVVKTWKLIGAFITKTPGSPLEAKGTDVAMEEFTLSYERLEIS